MSSLADTSRDHPVLDAGPASAPADHPDDLAGGVAPGASEPTADDDLDTELLPTEQTDALKDDPVALKKALHKAFTQKTQKLAAERRQLASYRDLIASLESDPDATIEALAKQAGFEVTKAQATTTKEADAVETIKTVLSESLGPEYEDLAERLAPALTKAVKAEAERAIAPIRSTQEQQLEASMLREANAEMERFGKSHPDWKTYEDEMNRLGNLLQPKPGMDPQAFLDLLYLAAKKDQAIADATGKALTKMQRTAEATVQAGGGVAADKVAMTPAKPLTFKDAAALAKRGIRVE